MTAAIDEPEKLDAMLLLFGLEKFPLSSPGGARWGLRPAGAGAGAGESGGRGAFGTWKFSEPLDVYIRAFTAAARGKQISAPLIHVDGSLANYLTGGLA